MEMGPALTSKAATKKAVCLYKAIVKQLPKIISTYQMNMSMAEAKTIVKNKFYANADVKDPRVAEILVYRAAMELDDGRIITAQDALQDALPTTYEKTYDPIDGYSIVTTLDTVIQQYIESALQSAVDQYQPERP